MSNSANNTADYSWTTYIEDADDGSGDGILTFPPELIEKMGWKEGTTLHLEVTEEGTLIITDKSLTNNENSV
tara:strand:+ start:517 stop:732 length:216 start_codon:yes stop_codon:yes gene_type:complete